MKYKLLFLALSTSACLNAQVTLSGNTYLETFDSLANGLPDGWEVHDAVGLNTLGTPTNFMGVPKSWDEAIGSFKNTASIIPFSNGGGLTPPHEQDTCTNRTLALRSDPGFAHNLGAFVLRLDNTVNLSNFSISFQIQSQDTTSDMEYVFSLQYGIGSSPTTFTTIDTFRVGHIAFHSRTKTFSIPSALNNINNEVVLRITNLNVPTGGSGIYPTVGIDSFSMTWSGNNNIRPNIVNLTPAHNATFVTLPQNLEIEFDRVINKGTGYINVHNKSLGGVQSIDVTSSDVTLQSKKAVISNVNLSLGLEYYVTFDSTAFDTAGYQSYGIYDNATWAFKMAPPVITSVSSLSEDFDGFCTNNNWNNWTQVSLLGDQEWQCDQAAGASGNKFLSINGYFGGNNENEDWLITPKLNLTNTVNARLHWLTKWENDGPALDVYVSTHYPGYGNPNDYNWTKINLTYNGIDSGNWHAKDFDLTPHKSSPLFVGFRYASNTTASAKWSIDSVVLESTSNIIDANAFSDALYTLQDANGTALFISTKQQFVQIELTDITGKMVYKTNEEVNKGQNVLSLNNVTLNTGLYILSVKTESQKLNTKIVIQ